jgi:bisphosphoglycerate-dependent phosphoglycerate mutase
MRQYSSDQNERKKYVRQKYASNTVIFFKKYWNCEIIDYKDDRNFRTNIKIQRSLNGTQVTHSISLELNFKI